MKILMLTDYFYPHIGGVENVILDLCTHLISNGHQVCVFTLNIPKTKQTETFNAIKIVRVNAIELTKLSGLQSAISFSAWFKLKKTIVDFKPDIIHSHHQFFFTTLLAMLLKKKFKIMTVTTLHLGSIDIITGVKGYLIKLIEKIMFKKINDNSDLVIAGSKNLKQHGVEMGIDKSKCVIIPNAVDLSFFKMPRSYSTNPRNVIFIGRLISTKGPQILIEAAKLVIEQISDVKFLIVGDGPLRTRLEEFVKKNNLSNNIVFLGRVDDIRTTMKDGDVYVRPSITDGMPYGILEAMAAGLPVIATNIAGTPDIIIHGKTGHLIKCGDAKKLASAILDLLENPNYMENLAKNGLKFVTSKYGWQDVYKSYENCYQKLFDDKNRFE